MTLNPRWWPNGVLLICAIFGFFVLNNAGYIFRTELHEYSDWAAISLQVRDAKHFRALVGYYSRWQFHHPGPALLYVFAAGEGIFYDLLHVVPTPFNGQKIALFTLNAFFFGASLMVVAQRVAVRAGQCWILPLLLLLAACHFGAVGRSHFLHSPCEDGLLSSWPPYVELAPFLCLLLAAASVASGGGKHLPLLVLTASFLVHLLVSQPLFVVPISCLAYLGLIRAVRYDASRPGLWPWQRFPAQHWCAVIILAVFLLPLAIDASKGGASNLALIVDHVRTHHGERKELLRSLVYFLQFGAYSRYPNPIQPESVSPSLHDAGALLLAHWHAYALWAGALLLPPVLFAITRRVAAARQHAGSLVPEENVLGRERQEFLVWLYIVLTLAVVLTIAWGCLQDGPMLYSNAYFNFSIYYALTLPLGIATALLFEAFGLKRKAPRLSAVGALIVVAGAVVANAHAFRTGGADLERQHAFGSSVERALTLPPVKRGTIFLAFEHEVWPGATGVALQLERRGVDVAVPKSWQFMFGEQRTVSPSPADNSARVWRIVGRQAAARIPTNGSWTLLPLNDDFALAVSPPPLTPDGGSISFREPANFGPYMRYGWSVSEGTFAWSESNVAQLDFQSAPAPTDVEVAIDAAPCLMPPKITAQQVDIFFDEALLDQWNLAKPDEPPRKIRIPARVWNAHAEHQLMFNFPNARSPRSLGVTPEIRVLGAAFRTIEFRLLR